MQLGGKFSEETISSFRILDVAIDGGFALEQGFILCAMILSAATVHLIDRQFKSSAVWMLIAAGLSGIGLMHSYILTEGDAAFSMTPPPWPFVRVYFALAILFGIAAIVVKDKKVNPTPSD